MVGSALGALYQIAPHWFFLNKVKDIYQSFSKGFPTLIKEEMLNLINEVTVKSVKLFVLTLTEPHAWGVLGRDALVGFPEFYYWKERSEVPFEQMRFNIPNYLMFSCSDLELCWTLGLIATCLSHR